MTLVKHIIFMLLLLVTFQKVYADNQQKHFFDKIVLFGDSLSDTGNLSAADTTHPVFSTLALPPVPQYTHGRFSNGEIWVDYFEKALKSHNWSGSVQNFAVAGGTVNINFVIQQVTNTFAGGLLPNQVEKFYKTPEAKQNLNDQLFVIWMGGNDYVPRKLFPNEATTDVVNQIQNQVKRLIKDGARTFLIPTLPNIGKAPDKDDIQTGKIWEVEVQDENHLPSNFNFSANWVRKSIWGLDVVRMTASEELEYVARMHNAKLKKALKQLELSYNQKNPGDPVHIVFADIFEYFMDVQQNPDRHGFTNVVDSCETDLHIGFSNLLKFHTVFNSTVPADLNELTEKFQYADYRETLNKCKTYLFYDGIHPTTKAHEKIAKFMLEALRVNNVCPVKPAAGPSGLPGPEMQNGICP